MAEPLKKYIDEGIEYFEANNCQKKEAARFVVDKYKLNVNVDSLRSYISKAILTKRHQGLADECEKIKAPADGVTGYWVKTKDYSIYVKNDQPEENSYLQLRDDFIKDLKSFAPVYPELKRVQYEHPHLLIFDPADIHFGKHSTKSETGEETSTSITKKRFEEGVDGIIEKVRGFKFDRIIYVGGNDVAHTDNAIGTTTSGTRQDVSGLWHENYLVAKQATVETIDKLLLIADVHYVHCISNHDFLTGFFLADALSSHYANNKNITFDVTPIHRKYVQYGSSLIGFTHGDGAKEADLSDLLKTECKAAWGMSKYAYWYVHHIHHKDKKAWKGSQKIKIEKDYRNITVLHTGLALSAEDYCFVEYVRSLSGTDRWHFTNGFVHAPKAIEVFIHCPTFGQIARFSHLF